LLSGTLSDYAYSNSYQIQWATFASWLNAGGLVFVLHPTLGKANRKFSLFFLLPERRDGVCEHLLCSCQRYSIAIQMPG